MENKFDILETQLRSKVLEAMDEVMAEHYGVKARPRDQDLPVLFLALDTVMVDCLKRIDPALPETLRNTPAA